MYLPDPGQPTCITLLRKLMVPLEQLSVANSSLAKVGASCPPPHARLCLVWACTGLSYPVKSGVGSNVQSPYYGFSVHPLSLVLTIFSSLLLQRYLRCRRIGSHLELSTPQFLVLCILTVVGLCVVISCRKKLLWWELKDAVIYGHNNMSSGGSLLLGLFSRLIVVVLP